ncbi:rod shape-determining protein MreC [Candidatus Obscuribacterales bacterium]|nr:rod shape-determining protein MreC [Candidatus Obscuribacterales bacterium]MBX3138247.1 rod shape-determining protein MreC [Candidatus Obscuribacterales bacterium]MBX3148849.1 rod shape-determining protein MreC [Candidatus Obscuribacterales bacterium]
MAGDSHRLGSQSESIAEAIFLIIVIIMIGGPAAGMLLTAATMVSGVITKSVYQVESTRNLAEEVFESSQRIRDLERKLAASELELTTLRRESRDTNNLRGLLGLKQKLTRKTIAAEVIARNPDNWFEQVVLDKGLEDGVSKGSAVITREGVVGQVVSVDKNASVVRLITDPEQKLGVLIKRIGLPGIIAGNGQQLAVMDYIPVGTSVDVGDKIVCFGKGGVFPENHPVGTVKSISRDVDGASMKIDVALSENCYDLNQVLVLPPMAQK